MAFLKKIRGKILQVSEKILATVLVACEKFVKSEDTEFFQEIKQSKCCQPQHEELISVLKVRHGN